MVLRIGLFIAILMSFIHDRLYNPAPFVSPAMTEAVRPSARRPSSVSPAVVIGLLALAVRLLYLWLESRYGIVVGSFFSGDSRTYDALAGELLSHGRYTFGGTPTAYVVPGYPLWLAFWFSVAGRNFALIGVV